MKSLTTILITSIIFFIYITGGSVLYTENTSWILNSYSIDYKQHWITWLFFQGSPFLQIPITDNFNYGMQLSTTLSVNDAIPIMALMFKLIQPIFELPSQYFGIWIFVSISLQSLFSYKLLKKFINDNYLCLIFSIFFIISPILLHRLSLGHTAMFAHWLILASFYLYFSETKKIYLWIGIILLSLFVNSYIASMVLLIFIADFFKIFLRNKNRVALKDYVFFALIIFSFFMSLPLIGLDINVSEYYKGGFGNYRFNLISFFDPSPTNWYHVSSWSNIVPNLPGEKSHLSGDYEGFAFLGIGVLALLPACIFYVIKNYKGSFNKDYVPLIVISIILFFYSLSNNIIFADINLFEYNVPNIVDSYTHSLRSSGRFIWPVYYLIYLFIFVVCCKYINNKILRYLITFLLLFQLYDSANAVQTLRNSFARTQVVTKSEWKLFMKDYIWEEMAKKYKNVRVIMPNGFPSKQYFPIALFAARNSMKTDSGYHARFDINKMSRYQEDVKKEINEGAIKNTDLYFFVEYDDKRLDSQAVILWEKINSNKDINDFSGVVDGFKVFAPNFFLK